MVCVGGGGGSRTVGPPRGVSPISRRTGSLGMSNAMPSGRHRNGNMDKVGALKDRDECLGLTHTPVSRFHKQRDLETGGSCAIHAMRYVGVAEVDLVEWYVRLTGHSTVVEGQCHLPKAPRGMQAVEDERITCLCRGDQDAPLK